MLPQPVTDLTGGRVGNTVTLHWMMTRRTTDRVALKGDQRALVCRAPGASPCQKAGELLLEAGKPAQFIDRLPPDLQNGPQRLLRYEVRLRNHAEQDAGASNPLFTAAGWAPPTVRAASAQVTAKGIAVQWQAPVQVPVENAKPMPAAHLLVRIERDRVLRPGESEKPGKQEVQAGVPQPLEQTLEAPEHSPFPAATAWSPDHILDADAAMNRSYRYTVQMVEQVTLEGHAMELSGLPAQTDPVAAKDVFPPGVPADLAAVANAEGGTVDLAWSADADQDVAGYFIYRRVSDASGAPERVSGAAPLATPNWSDPNAVKGVRYAYSVSAVDRSGNESGRSAEVVEELPQ